MKKLYKNEHDEVLTGIIGGIGEYFAVDPTVLRIAFVVLVLITGIFPGVIAYIIAYFIIPERPHSLSTIVTPPPMKTSEDAVSVPTTQHQPEASKPAEEPIAPTAQKETSDEQPLAETKPEEPTSTI